MTPSPAHVLWDALVTCRAAYYETYLDDEWDDLHKRAKEKVTELYGPRPPEPKPMPNDIRWNMAGFFEVLKDGKWIALFPKPEPKKPRKARK